MAQRGIAVCIDSTYQDTNVIGITMVYSGFQHVDERHTFTVQVGPSLSSGSALKAAARDMLVEWYGQNQSENYDEWDDTPVVGDNFVIVGGIV